MTRSFPFGRIGRRQVLRASGILGALGLGVLTGCSPQAQPTQPPPAPKPAESTPAAKPAAQPTTAPSKPPQEAPKAQQPAIGTSSRPIEMAFVPSLDSQKVLASGKPLAELLTKDTGLIFNVSVPTSYVAVIEAMGAGKVDVGFLSTFAYSLAHSKYGVDVILSSVRSGSKTYVSQFIVHADSGVKTVEGLKGKRFAFVDSASASGYLYPAALIKEKFNLEPAQFFSQVVTAGGHDKVVIAVYNKQVDGGCTFGRSNLSNPAEEDARHTVKSTLPDVIEKVVRIQETDPIPNDTVSVRKDLPKEIIDKVKNGLLKVVDTEDGKKIVKELYRWDGVGPATDADYAPLRQKAALMKIDIEEQIKPKS